MIKITIPIKRPSVPPEPTTNSPKAVTIFPSNFEPLERISLVDETFNAKLNTVETRSTVGKVEKSVDFGVYKVIRTIRTDSSTLHDIKKSSNTVGSGIINIRITETTATATKRLVVDFTSNLIAKSPHPK
jgi:hypothetical protein